MLCEFDASETIGDWRKFTRLMLEAAAWRNPCSWRLRSREAFQGVRLGRGDLAALLSIVPAVYSGGN